MAPMKEKTGSMTSRIHGKGNYLTKGGENIFLYTFLLIYDRI
jgi:hypothetical protein